MCNRCGFYKEIKMQIIAGPALRHSSNDEINLWLVLDTKASNIDAEIIAPGGKILGTSKANSRDPVRAGEKAYVYMLKLIPGSGRFPSDQILNYDIVIDGQRLADFGLTKGRQRITYGNDPLPGLVLKQKHQVILQGSCRKPHAAKNNISQPDMLVTADVVVQQSKQNANKRPSLLFLTGDQIYGDDVAAPMLAKIKMLVKDYIGYDQQIPKTASSKIRPSTLDLNGRTNLLSGKNMGFSSTSKDNHLLSFGEYFMMHCVVWGGLGAQCPHVAEVRNDLAREDYEGEMDELENKYWTERLIVEGFLNNAWRVRRLMANVPTYMIFDDHDVTDDWNLDEGNNRAFRTNIFSRHVQVNALSAYWLCQGWGNTPDQFPPAFRKQVQEYLNNYPENKFNVLESSFLDRYWGYEIETYPHIVVLDTRTKRSYNNKKLAKLMAPEVLSEVAQRIKSVDPDKKTDNSLLLISATPVYGFTQVERQQLAMSESMARSLDVECWIADEMAYRQLQSTLVESGYNRCSIFSGDVHYGFCRYEQLVSSAGQPVHVYQLTSSSLHNAPGFVGGIGLKLLSASEAFKKHHTSYLLPKNSDDDFINQSTNIGLLQLTNGQPDTFVLNSETPLKEQARGWLGNDKGFSWIYDLNNPVKLQ